MKFDYKVKYKGKWYMPGEEIVDNETGVEKSAPVIVSEDVAEPVKYTKTEINRMSTADLQALAKEQGIEDAEDLSGSSLKKILIDKLV